jgi:hypothetical protein
MRLLGVAVIPAFEGVLLVSSGVVSAAPAGPPIGTRPSGSSSCSGCLKVGTAGRFTRATGVVGLAR